MRIGTIELRNIRGVVEKAVGLGKETVGTVLGNERLVEAGEAQQAAATERLRAFREQTKAQAREAEADVQERRQRAAQKSKEATNS